MKKFWQNWCRYNEMMRLTMFLFYIYYKEVTLPQFLQNYKETKTKF